MMTTWLCIFLLFSPPDLGSFTSKGAPWAEGIGAMLLLVSKLTVEVVYKEMAAVDAVILFKSMCGRLFDVNLKRGGTLIHSALSYSLAAAVIEFARLTST